MKRTTVNSFYTTLEKVCGFPSSLKICMKASLCSFCTILKPTWTCCRLICFVIGCNGVTCQWSGAAIGTWGAETFYFLSFTYKTLTFSIVHFSKDWCVTHTNALLLGPLGRCFCHMQVKILLYCSPTLSVIITKSHSIDTYELYCLSMAICTFETCLKLIKGKFTNRWNYWLKRSYHLQICKSRQSFVFDVWQKGTVAQSS